MKFKKHDTVFCVERDVLSDYLSAGYEPGKKFVIDRTTVESSGEPIYWAENGHGVYERELELVNKSGEEKMIEFKKGDEVRLTEDYGNYSKGYTFTVKNSSVVREKLGLVVGENITVYAKRLELVDVQQGSIVVDDYGDYYRVYAVLDNYYVVSSSRTAIEHLPEPGELDGVDNYLKSELKLFTPEKTKEVTLEEVAAKFNVDVSNIRIKD